MAEPGRELVAEYPARRQGPDLREIARRARGLEGRFRSGHPDLAEEHDRYLHDGEALARDDDLARQGYRLVPGP